MISEQELEALSFPGAPKIISAVLPGPTSATLLEEAPNYESMTRGGGRFPLVFDSGKGRSAKGKIINIAPVADPASDTISVKIELPNPTSRPPGEHVKVFFPAAGKAREL